MRKNQIKLYLAIFAIALLCTNIYSAKLKTEAMVEAKTETETTQISPKGDEVDCDEVNEQLGENNLIIKDTPIPTPQCVTKCRDPNQIRKHVWTRIQSDCKNKFHDVGVSSQGAIVGVGTNGLLYFYEFDLDKFTEIGGEGDQEVKRLRRVDIGYDGLIYVVNLAGDTYYLNCKRYWTKLPGCAIDIGTGRGDEVAKIGCNDYCIDPEDSPCQLVEKERVETESQHLYKLHCDCECKCCHRRCNIFVKFVYDCNDKGVDRTCYWIKYPDGPTYLDKKKNRRPCLFTRIDVNSSGYPVVVAKCGVNYKIYQMYGNDLNVYAEILNNKKVKINDVCGDNLGNIFYITDTQVFVYNRLNGDVALDLTKAEGKGNIKPGKNISCGPYAQPTITEKDCCMRTTSKVGYN